MFGEVGHYCHLNLRRDVRLQPLLGEEEGMVVELRPEDLQDASLRHLIQKVSQESDFADIASRWEEEPLLGMLHLQEALEYTCWCHAHRSQQAPIQRMTIWRCEEF